MKRLCLSLFLVLPLLGAQAAAAADGPRKGPPPEPKWSELAQELNIKGSAQQSFISIMHQQHEKRVALQQSAREQGREKMQALHEETKRLLQSVLSADQLAAFEAKMEQRRRQHAQHMQEREGGQERD